MVFYLVASTLGAAVTGLAVGLFGVAASSAGAAWLLTFAVLVISIAGVFYGVADLLGWRVHPPTSTWQVPAKWGFYGPTRFAAAFGFSLGLGWATVVPYFGFYMLLAVCASLEAPLQSAGVMALFGFARGVPLVVARSLWARGRPLSISDANRVAHGLAAVSGARGMVIWRGALLVVSTFIVWI
jgi:hypothetical protein